MYEKLFLEYNPKSYSSHPILLLYVESLNEVETLVLIDELFELKKQLHDLTSKAKQAENFRNKLQELDKVIAINNATEKLNEIDKNILAIESRIKVLKSAIQLKKKEKIDLEEKRIELSKTVISESLLYETKNWFRFI